MKPFNLEEAKAGKKVVTREGRNVRLVSFNNDNPRYPIVGIIEHNDCDEVNVYTIAGMHLALKGEHDNDLFMVDNEPEASDLQKWCKEILPIVQAAASGEEIECLLRDGWFNKTSRCFDHSIECRIKPKVKAVNGFEVPMHETSALSNNTTYYTPDIHNKAFNTLYWWGDSDDHRFLANGIVYLDKESATKCAKAMLGINPEEE